VRHTFVDGWNAGLLGRAVAYPAESRYKGASALHHELCWSYGYYMARRWKEEENAQVNALLRRGCLQFKFLNGICQVSNMIF
jgi:hypothetical protein